MPAPLELCRIPISAQNPLFRHDGRSEGAALNVVYQIWGQSISRQSLRILPFASGSENQLLR